MITIASIISLVCPQIAGLVRNSLALGFGAAAVGGGGKCVRISCLRAANGFPCALMTTSTSLGDFNVWNDTYMTFDLAICLMISKHATKNPVNNRASRHLQ